MPAALLPWRFASIVELARALRSGRTSSRELTQQSAAGLELFARPLNGVAALVPERAAQEALAADRRLADGDQGILCGIPYGAKDIFAARGASTQWGSPAFAGQRLESDATAVRRLSRAGAVLTAKLATVELAGAGRPARWGSSLTGQGRNPWDVRRYSGGSSSGPGIAVAVGVVPFALATETGGSILAPSAFCGVTGLRPSYGRVPTSGVMPLSPSLDKVGVVARSAEDCGHVLAGMMGTGPSSFGNRDGTRPTIGIPRGAVEEVAPSMQQAVGGAISAFGASVANVVTVDVPNVLPFAAWLETIMNAETAFAFRHHLRRPDFTMTDERSLATMRDGLRIPAVEYLEARAGQRQCRSLVGRLFARVDFLMASSQPRLPPTLDEAAGPRTSATTSELLKNLGNLAGLPAVSFPCGLTHDGVPVAVQVVGPRGADESLLRLVAAYQRETDFHTLRPPDVASRASAPVATSGAENA